MQIIIGMDGGGTKTKSIACSIDGNILFETSSGPSNFLMIGTEKVSQTILELIDRSLEALSLNYADILSVVIGTTGAGRRTDADTLENDFNDLLIKNNISVGKFRVESDARIALEAAFSGKPGSILIAGTGSIMFGKDIDGNIHRVGGFGRFIGDEGSGFILGKKGLTAVAKNMDGRGLPTILTDIVAKNFNINDLQSLITEIYKNNFDIASVAPHVIEAADKGDEICKKIINEESEELVIHIKAMMKAMKSDHLDLSLIGGTITTNNIYANLFREKVKKTLSNVNIKKPDAEPAYGAFLMAKNLIK